MPPGAEDFALLTDDLFAGVQDALAVVRLGASLIADVGRELTNEMLVWASDRDLRATIDVELDTRGRRQIYGVAEANVELYVLAHWLGVPTDADNIEHLGVALSDANNHVLDAAASRAPLRSGATIAIPSFKNVTGDGLAVLVPLHIDVVVPGVLEVALGTRDSNAAVVRLDVDLHAARNRNRSLSDTRHRCVPQFTTATISPPTRCERALRPLMTPMLVETIAVPSPCKGRGISEWLA